MTPEELDSADPMLWWGSATVGTNAPSGWMRASEARSRYSQGNSQERTAAFRAALAEAQRIPALLAELEQAHADAPRLAREVIDAHVWTGMDFHKLNSGLQCSCGALVENIERHIDDELRRAFLAAEPADTVREGGQQ